MPKNGYFCPRVQNPEQAVWITRMGGTPHLLPGKPAGALCRLVRVSAGVPTRVSYEALMRIFEAAFKAVKPGTFLHKITPT